MVKKTELDKLKAIDELIDFKFDVYKLYRILDEMNERIRKLEKENEKE